jgi:hypothetical protein
LILIKSYLPINKGLPRMFFHNNITERRNVLDIGGGKKKKEKEKV